MGTLLYLLMVGVSFAIPPLIARLILNTFFPEFWSHNFVHWSLCTALVCLTYLLFETLSFRGDVQIPISPFQPVIARASYSELAELFSAESALYNLVRVKHILDCFFPFVVAPAALVAMTIYTVERSQQHSRSEN